MKVSTVSELGRNPEMSHLVGRHCVVFVVSLLTVTVGGSSAMAVTVGGKARVHTRDAGTDGRRAFAGNGVSILGNAEPFGALRLPHRA